MAVLADGEVSHRSRGRPQPRDPGGDDHGQPVPDRVDHEDDAAFANQIADLDFPAEITTADPPITDTLHAGPGCEWGYGMLLNSADSPSGRKAGTGAWAGLLNTHFFIDRTTGTCASICANSLPFMTEHEAWKLYGDFEKSSCAAL